MTEFNPLNIMWTEKYRPKKLADVVGDFKEDLINALKDPQNMNHLLFYSKHPGTGKTSSAKAIINELDADNLIINSSDNRGIDYVRDTVKAFASTMSSKQGKRRIIFLDEADGLTPDAQLALRNTMESYAKNALFILTCNNIKKIISPIQDRCTKYHFKNPDKADIKKYLENIMEKEDINWSEEGIEALIEVNYPSIRSCVKMLQDMKTNGKDVIPENISKSNEQFEEMWQEVSQQKEYKKIKQFVFETGVDARELNLYFWEKSWETDNQRMIQITCKNEVAISQGADSKVVFASSLVEMCK